MLLVCGTAVPRLTHHCRLLRRCVATSSRVSVHPPSPCPSSSAIPSRSYSTHGPLIHHPTVLLKQSTITTVPAAGSPSAAASTPPSAAVSGPGNENAILFYDTFTISSEDVHLLLLEEAHRKHGVWMNVPPQLAPTVPNVGPPTIPEPIYPPKQLERLNALTRAATAAHATSAAQRIMAQFNGVLHNENCLAYPPTHEPPPFVTTGTRTLWISNDQTSSDVNRSNSNVVASPSAAIVTVSAATVDVGNGGSCAGLNATAATSTQLQAKVAEVAVRAPIDLTMKFHCSCCGRAFRRREAAVEHVERRHTSTSGNVEEAAATVLEGAGPGEIIGYKNVIGASMTPAAAVAATATGVKTKGANEAVSGADGQADIVFPVTNTFAETERSSSNSSSSTSIAATEEAAVAPERTQGKRASPTSPSTARLIEMYKSKPTVSLPSDDLIDDLLLTVWDEVGLTRDDVEKAAGVQSRKEGSSDKLTGAAGLKSNTTTVYSISVDSCNGKYFIPSSSFIQGKADIRDEMEAELAAKPSARATPLGAAPGVKRTITTTRITVSGTSPRRLHAQRRNLDGTVTLVGGVDVDDKSNHPTATRTMGLSITPTAQEMSIMELSRHYPNPFGDSPNAALVEQEKEPVNPFRDLEGRARIEVEGRLETHTAAETKAETDVLSGRKESNAMARVATSAKRDQNKGEAEEATLRKVWLLRFASRPYACPVCQQRVLPGLAAALNTLTENRVHSSATGGTQTAASVERFGASECSLSEHAKTNPGQQKSNAHRKGAQKGASLSSATQTNPSKVPLSTSPGVVSIDVEALKWYESTVPRFRLLDALEDHLESCHHGLNDASTAFDPTNNREGGVDVKVEGVAEPKEDEISECEWKRLYGIAASPTQSAEVELTSVLHVYRATKKAAVASAALESHNSSTRGASPSVSGAQTSLNISGDEKYVSSNVELNADTTGEATGSPMCPSDQGGQNGAENDSTDDNSSNSSSAHSSSAGLEDLRDASEDADAPHVHVRTAVNAVLVGTVRDVQEGFVGTTRVIQYVLAISNNNINKTDPAARTPAAAGDAEGATAYQKLEEYHDEELIVVRCMGDLVPAALLHHQVHLGSTLFVTGTLRLNRNVDTTSRRSHAYPYVQVVPPLGSVRVLQ